jgi:DNA-binding response OmpR family regulator
LTRGNKFRIIQDKIETGDGHQTVAFSTKENYMTTLIPRIMVAEDSEDLRFLITRVLAKNGFEVEAYEDGSETLSHLVDELNKNELPSLLITDINMPNMNGRELIERMRKVHGLESLPVIIYSSEVEVKNGDYDPVYDTHSLHKPAMPKELVAVIKKLLESKAA